MATLPSSSNRKEVLYISYDGILEPLGQSQVLAYLEKLAQIGWKINLISYEKRIDWCNKSHKLEVSLLIKRSGISWYPLRYHKKLPLLSTLYDVIRGFFLALWLSKRRPIGIIHVRSYVAAIIGLQLKRLKGLKLIFDMRGFWPDERIECGLWNRNSFVYLLAKKFERRFLLSSDIVVSLTNAGVQAMKEFSFLKNRQVRFEIVPTCTDMSRFRPASDETRDGSEFVLGYVGSASNWYLFEPVLTFYRSLLQLRPDATLLILNRNEHKYIRNLLLQHQVDDSRVLVVSAPFEQVPIYMSRMSAGVFFIKPVFSKKASSPTKLGEFLSCGVPCVSNAGVGDVQEIVEENRVGILLRELSTHSCDRAAADLVNVVADLSTSARCINTARKYFSLDKGVKAYDRMYRSIDGESSC